MSIKKIYTGQSECLYKNCREVERFDAKLWKLLDDMADTMYAENGVGLAAPQIGILRRVVVIDCGDGLVELINPKIIETSGEQGCFEGCLSFPGERGYVTRANKVTLQAYDRNGDLYEYVGEGIFARAMLHETDHLDGKVYKRLVTEPPQGYSEDIIEEEE